MAFGFNHKTELSVLEAKFSIYEDLSKEMLDKLERAVDKISESNPVSYTHLTLPTTPYV